MSITDELRERIDDEALLLSTRRELWNIADRIDAEHESMVSYWQGASYKNGYDEGFASADDWLAQHEDAMAEHGWAKLPVDADGEYIHIGDRVENNERVVRIVLTDGSWEPSVYIEKLPNVMHEYFCNEISHYHAPTVEDVLEEFAQMYIACNDKGTIAEYAKRLRLVGEE